MSGFNKLLSHLAIFMAIVIVLIEYKGGFNGQYDWQAN